MVGYQREVISASSLKIPVFDCIASDERACYHYNIIPGTTSRRQDTLRWRNRLESLYFFKRFAFSRRHLRPYWAVSELLVIKKGWVMALRDFFSNNLKRK